MRSGRILIVSDREDVLEELESILRLGAHHSLRVIDGEQALRTLVDGLVPDLVISDLGSDRALEGIEYFWRFREMNRVGRHMVVVESGAPFSQRFASGGPREQVTALSRPFSPDDVTGRIADALDAMGRELQDIRAELWRELARMHQATRDLQRDAVMALAATIAARDPYMHGHATRVAAFCQRVARAMHLADEDARLLEAAATLHEIGKGSIPLDLLHKTEPLTSEELDRIRSHARIGAAIVAAVPSLRSLAPIIEHQGTDYHELNRHLDAGSAEFLLTGILRVVDAYDAMLSPRSYRGPMPREYWETVLRAGAGTRFQPEVVTAFLELIAG
jgi:response regulator RpfG family c-di-GMP phosphodiesterase